MLLFFLIFINSATLVFLAPPKLLIVAYDGLRWDYVTPKLMPTMWNIGQSGVFARQGIKNQVVTVTSPTFYTIATGLYQESSGITGNQMFDPTQQGQDRFFDYWNFGFNDEIAIHSRDARWYKGTPIWLTNQENGADRASGSMWWPMGDAKVQNKTAKKIQSCVMDDQVLDCPIGNLSFYKQSFDKLLEWFKDEQNPINFGMFYAPQPDHNEHISSVYSDLVRNILKDLDDLTAYIIEQIKIAGLDKDLNIIFTADHGHANIYKEFSGIDFDTILDPSTYIMMDKSIFPNISNGGNASEIYQKILDLRQKKPNFYVWCKSKTEIPNCIEEIPETFRYKNSDRIGSIVVIEYLGYLIYQNHTVTASYPIAPLAFGSHGFLPNEHEMWPYFVTTGPAFKKNFVLETIAENIDLYNLMCYILEVDAAPNNGSFDRIRQILADEGSKWVQSTTEASKTSTTGEAGQSSKWVQDTTQASKTSTTGETGESSKWVQDTTQASKISTTGAAAIAKGMQYGFYLSMLYLLKSFYYLI